MGSSGRITRRFRCPFPATSVIGDEGPDIRPCSPVGSPARSARLLVLDTPVGRTDQGKGLRHDYAKTPPSTPKPHRSTRRITRLASPRQWGKLLIFLAVFGVIDGVA